ncbi:MAG: DegQ family serine endoprotease [Robiginitomaculum sp.]
MRKLLTTSALVLALSMGASAPAYAQLRLPGLSSQSSGDALTVDPKRGVLTLAPLLERTTPAVVNISVLSTVKPSARSRAGEDAFRRFLEQNGLGGKNREQEQQGRETSSAGSGVIIDAGKGYILTNHHVVDGADEVKVTLKDSRTVTAKIIGSDSKTDIALLQIEAGGLTALKLADSDDSRVGDYVIAIGNPFGLGQTVTSGIISALGRSGINRDGYEDFIQTDASINPGNSGGALINSKGELIGINTAIISRSGSSAGIGFAVPSNMASQVIDQLSRYGEVHRGRIGVGIQDLTADLREALSITAEHGALVRQVEEGSPADKAGLEIGDVIIRFNEEHIASSRDIRNAVGFVEHGTRNDITYMRDGRSITAKINVEQVPEDETDIETDDPSNDNEQAGAQGFRGASITAIPSDANPTGGNDGVYITSVKIGSKAARAGLKKGDIIRAVGRADIGDMAGFKKAIKGKDGVIALTVQRGRTQVFIAIK